MKGGWIAVQLDAVSAEVFDHDEAVSAPDVALGFLRIVSTRAAIQRVTDPDEVLEIGDWVEAYVDPKAVSGPRSRTHNVWHGLSCESLALWIGRVLDGAV